MILSSDANLTACEWMNWNKEKARRNHVNKSVVVMTIAYIMTFNAILEIDLKLEIILLNDVTIYEFNSLKLVNLINKYQNLFKDKDMIVTIFKKEWMLIILKSNAILKFTHVYFVERKKREIINSTLDKLHKKSKMRFLTQLISFSFSVFVIWRNLSDEIRKERMIMNLKDLNEMIEINSYSMKQQSEIIAVIARYSHIFIVDAIDYFHQFLVHWSNHSKFIIVSHRDQEKFNVTLMKYKRSLSYVQRQTDAMLHSYRKFTHAYINNIIIFSLILKNYLQHLRNIFDLFRAWCVSLIFNKSFLDYSSIILLNQWVNSLRIFTFKNKIKIIISLQFSDNLRDLKTFLDLIEWLCFSISWYAQRAWFLQKRKTTLFKEVSNIKDSKDIQRWITDKQFYESMNKEFKTFSDLKNVFSVSTFLAHFDLKRQLYINLDAFKTWDFAFMIYHIKNFVVDNIKFISHIFVELILFLSRMLNTAEANYWSTELKVADIVWIIKRVHHLIDFTDISSIIIYINHSTAISISR